MTGKNNVLWYLLRGLEVSMQALLFFAIALMLFGNVFLMGSKQIVFCAGISVLSAAVLYVVRRVIKQNILLILLHLGMGIFFLTRGGTGEERLAYLLFGGGVLLYSLLLCGNGGREAQEKVPIGFGCLFFAVMVYGSAMGVASIGFAAMYAGGIFFILQVLYKNYDSVNKYISLNRGIANFPIRQVVAVNSFQMTILVSLFSGVLLIVGCEKVSRMASALGGFLWESIKYLLRKLFSIGKDLEPGSTFVPEGGEGNGIAELHSIVQDSYLTDIWNGLGAVAGGVIGVVAVVGFCVAVTVGIAKAIRNLSGETGTDIKEFVVPGETREFYVGRNKRKKQRFGKGNNAKVRKLYKAQVEKRASRAECAWDDNAGGGSSAGGGIIRENMTASEITERYLSDASEMVTPIYQKARYGKESAVTEEELGRFRRSW